MRTLLFIGARGLACVPGWRVDACCCDRQLLAALAVNSPSGGSGGPRDVTRGPPARTTGVALPLSLTPSVLAMVPSVRGARVVSEAVEEADEVAPASKTSRAVEPVQLRVSPPLDMQQLAATAEHINQLTQAAKEVGRSSDALFLALYFKNKWVVRMQCR